MLTQYSSSMGFYCVAAENMPELTLLAEYCGEVRTEEQILNSKNDSIMELLQTNDASTSLNVVPERYSNIARFFNGINNNQQGSKRNHQNVRTIRCQVGGKATVLLYTNRKVKKGEELRYDYNEAGYNWYNTSYFV